MKIFRLLVLSAVCLTTFLACSPSTDIEDYQDKIEDYVKFETAYLSVFDKYVIDAPNIFERNRNQNEIDAACDSVFNLCASDSKITFRQALDKLKAKDINAFAPRFIEAFDSVKIQLPQFGEPKVVGNRKTWRFKEQLSGKDYEFSLVDTDGGKIFTEIVVVE